MKPETIGYFLRKLVDDPASFNEEVEFIKVDDVYSRALSGCSSIETFVDAIIAEGRSKAKERVFFAMDALVKYDVKTKRLVGAF